MKTSELLIAARDELIEHGWCQGTAQAEDGRLCASAAIFKIEGNSIARIRAMNHLEEAIGLIPTGLVRSWRIAPWNDYRSRTFNEVIDAFDHAIILAKEQEA